MSQSLRILLVSPDLMVTSRLAAVGRDCGAVIETVRSLDDPPPGLAPPYGVVLLDLQAQGADPAVLVAKVQVLLAGLDPAPRLVAFGPHVHRQRLDDACAAGADEAISRGELLGSLPALVRRWTG
jgi:hypothetical protein